MKFLIGKTKITLGKRKGQTAYYAQKAEGRTISWNEVQDRISRHTGISRSDLNGAIVAIVDLLEEELPKGNSVDLGEIGTFKPSATGKRMSTREAVTVDTISPIRIVLTFRTRLRRLAQTILPFLSNEEFVSPTKRRAALNSLGLGRRIKGKGANVPADGGSASDGSGGSAPGGSDSAGGTGSQSGGTGGQVPF